MKLTGKLTKALVPITLAALVGCKSQPPMTKGAPIHQEIPQSGSYEEIGKEERESMERDIRDRDIRDRDIRDRDIRDRDIRESIDYTKRYR